MERRVSDINMYCHRRPSDRACVPNVIVAFEFSQALPYLTPFYQGLLSLMNYHWQGHSFGVHTLAIWNCREKKMPYAINTLFTYGRYELHFSSFILEINCSEMKQLMKRGSHKITLSFATDTHSGQPSNASHHICSPFFPDSLQLLWDYTC